MRLGNVWLVRDVRGRWHRVPRVELLSRIVAVLLVMLLLALLVVHVTALVELDAEAELFRETLLGITRDWPVEAR